MENHLPGSYTNAELQKAIDKALYKCDFDRSLESYMKRVVTMLSQGSTDKLMNNENRSFLSGEASNLWKVAALVAHDQSGNALNPQVFTVPMVSMLWKHYHKAQNDLLKSLIGKMYSLNSIDPPQGSFAINEQGFMVKRVDKEWQQLGHKSFCSELRLLAMNVYKHKNQYCTTYIFDSCIMNVILRTLAAGAVKKATRKSKKTHLEAIAHFAVILMLMYRKTPCTDFTLDKFKERNCGDIEGEAGINYQIFQAATISISSNPKDLLDVAVSSLLVSPFHDEVSTSYFADFDDDISSSQKKAVEEARRHLEKTVDPIPLRFTV